MSTSDCPSFLEAIERNGTELGSQPAFSTGETTYSYSELYAIAGGIREELLRLGCGHNQRIGLVAGSSVHTTASILAIWSLGAAYVPLNVHYPAERNGRIVASSGLDLVLTSRSEKDWPGYLPKTEGSFRLVHSTNLEPASGNLGFPQSDPSDIAYLFFTSGSTGLPKGVPITHGNLSAFMDSFISRMGYELGVEDRFLQMFELTFDLSVVSIVAPLSVGGCCCPVPERGIKYLNVAKVLAEQEITVALMVPSILPYMRRFFSELRFPALRLSQFCGEALMQDIAAEWSQCVPNARIENVYGPTEATIFCTRYAWDRDKAATESVNGIVPIGQAMPGTTTHVVDDNGRLCAVGERGELCLAGDQVMPGYWNDPDKTAEAFLALSSNGSEVTAYRTGDVVFVNEHGNLIYCGRKDSQVKIDGHRVELGEVEHFARLYPGIESAAGVMARDASGVERLKLFVAGTDIDCKELESHLQSSLPDYMWPTNITVLPELPLNLNGKVDRPALRQL